LLILFKELQGMTVYIAKHDAVEQVEKKFISTGKYTFYSAT